MLFSHPEVSGIMLGCVFLHDANKICLPWDETKGQVTGAKPNGIMLEGCDGWRDPNHVYLVLCIGNSPWGVHFPNIPPLSGRVSAGKGWAGEHRQGALWIIWIITGQSFNLGLY